jgi:hypothetical protein
MVNSQEYSNLTLDVALRTDGANPEMALQRKLGARVSSLATEMSTFRQWADRYDALFYTTTLGPWGADLWASDPSAMTPGRSHVSLTGYPKVYVVVPAALQSYEPIENMLATENTDESRHAANALERVRKAWKFEERWQLKRHKAATIKELYGRTASFVYYDKAEARACADIIENPRNLWLGYKSDDYTKLEWAAHVRLMDPSAVMEQYSVDFTAKVVEGGTVVPWIVGLGDSAFLEPHPELTFGPAKIEVWDFWYLMPGKSGKRGEPTKMTTWNAVIAGNQVVRGPFEYKEYKGKIPYKPLFNDFIPGTPTGRSALHDIENLLREKMTRITAGAQMIAKATAGDYWQITGENAPSKGSAGVKPKLNETISAGPGNRIEPITPVVIQFQLEQFLGRIDREMATESGLNDMLLGLAPSAVVNSSKAINAIVANYETRIAIKRLMFYEWDRDTWEFTLDIWAEKDKRVRQIIDAGGGTLDIIAPTLSPRDEQETASRAAALVNAKLWSQARGMDAVGVDDPEQEQDIIRGERTDATMWPADVQTMAQLMGILKSLGLTPPPGAQAQVAGQVNSGTEALRQALGAGTPPQQEGDQYSPTIQAPGITGAPAAAGGGPFASIQQGPTTQLQSMIQGGATKSRILSSQTLGRK